ncbi:MAG: hypothetical protein V3U76_16175 [Granulosicoccus sp.]
MRPVKRDVLRVCDIGWRPLCDLFSPYGLQLKLVEDGKAIPGSHWGDDEAGLIAYELFARPDTPVHSVLHEAGHWLLMDDERRDRLHTDAGGNSAEENAVCYLQILMADCLDGVGRQRMFEDMDSWGYSFRLGSAKRWFHEDAEDAKLTLLTLLGSDHNKSLNTIYIQGKISDILTLNRDYSQ